MGSWTSWNQELMTLNNDGLVQEMRIFNLNVYSSQFPPAIPRQTVYRRLAHRALNYF